LKDNLKVTEVSDFESIRNVWDQVLEENRFGNNIFLTVDWLSTWWKHFGGQRKLLLLTVEEDNQVLGIAPMMLSKYKLPGFGSIRKIEFLGTRHSDYNNFIISKKESECVRHIIDYLNEVEDWDWIELKEIPENINYSKQLFADPSLKLEIKERVCNQCPYIPLPRTFECLKKTFGRNLRQNLNRNLRKIQENHSVDLKRFDEAGFSVKEAMNLFIRLHEMKWKSQGQPGAFAEDTFRNFHMDVAEALAQNGWLGIYFLRVDGEPVAAQYTFEYYRKMYYYLSGFLPKYKSFSVGNLIIMFLLRECIEKGFTEYDMTRGDEPYKMQWTNKYRRNFEVRLVHKKITSKLYDRVTWGSTVENVATKLRISLKKSS
jgi:CelD/BcsL family acetyltransferase involved in cellulose biosynthesis